MKLPGDSDNMDKGVSHEMMQKSLQSQRRVVKRVGLLEDKVDNNSYNFSARLEIDYVNSKYNLNIPIGDYDTLGGFILHIRKNIPKKNEKITYKDFEMKILSIRNNRIDNVFFRKNVK